MLVPVTEKGNVKFMECCSRSLMMRVGNEVAQRSIEERNAYEASLEHDLLRAGRSLQPEYIC